MVAAAKPRHGWPSALCAASGLTAATAGPLGLLGPGAQVVAGVAGGMGSAVLLGRWFMAFCYEPVKTSVVRVLFAFPFNAVLRMGLFGVRLLSPAACGALLAALPLLSAAVLVRLRIPVHKKAWATGAGGGTLQPSSEVPRFFSAGNALLVFEIAVFGLAMGATRANFAQWSMTGSVGAVTQLVQVLIPLVLYWWFRVRAEHRRHETPVRTCIVAGSIAVLALFVFGGLVQYALSTVSMCTSTLVPILMYIRMLDSIGRSATHLLVVFGLVRGSLELAIVTGWGVVLATGRLAGIELLPLNVASFVVGSVLILLVNSYSLRSAWEFLDEPRDQKDPLEARCAELAQTYRLTEAESNVMRYLCLGRSKKYIAAELVMSEDSVRYHAKQLYRKLDVHTREELMTVAGVE